MMLSTRELIKKYQIKPKHRAGQCFLIDQNNLEKIVKSAELKSTDNVLEIGPGLGVLTERLLAQVSQVVAVELDKSLHYVLKQEFRGINNLKLIQQDILSLKPSELKEFFNGQPYKIVANIPYNITSDILTNFLTSDYPPQSMVLLMQKEVAKRIIAKPGQMSRLAILVRYYSEPQIIDYVSKNCFYPKPEIESAIVKLTLKKNNHKINPKRLFQLVRIGFSSKRKQLQNNLSNGFHLDREVVKVALKKAGLKETCRAQELSLADWQALVPTLQH